MNMTQTDGGSAAKQYDQKLKALNDARSHGMPESAYQSALASLKANNKVQKNTQASTNSDHRDASFVKSLLTNISNRPASLPTAAHVTRLTPGPSQSPSPMATANPTRAPSIPKAGPVPTQMKPATPASPDHKYDIKDVPAFLKNVLAVVPGLEDSLMPNYRNTFNKGSQSQAAYNRVVDDLKQNAPNGYGAGKLVGNTLSAMGTAALLGGVNPATASYLKAAGTWEPPTACKR